MKRIVHVYGLLALTAALVTNDEIDALTDTISITKGFDGLLLPHIRTRAVLKFFQLAQQFMGFVDMHDKSLHNFGVTLSELTPGFDLFIDGPQTREVINQDYSSEIITKGLSFMSNDACLRSGLTTGQFIREILGGRFRIGGICQVTSKPDPKLVRNVVILSYRTFRGEYNNLENPTWGKAGTPFPRLLPPEYGNDVDAPRRAKSGKELPNPRTISLNVYSSFPMIDSRMSIYTTFMSQLVAHDGASQLMDINLDSPIGCCSDDMKCPLPKILRHKSCFPIKIPDNDPFYSRHDIGCFNFIRSASAPRPDCLLSWREQINAVSGYLDLSVVYGSSTSMANSLRVRQDGLLRESSNDQHHLPSCSRNDRICYVAGDIRCNQQIYLASLHTIFMREHNRIAERLLELNPRWNDETLYHESRRILIAVYHHIVYWELLPVLFGKSFPFDIFGELDQDGFSSCYDPSINGAIHNEFSIALRSIHTLVPGEVTVCRERRECFRAQLRDIVGNMTFLEASSEGLDDTYRGMSMSTEKFDRFFSSELMGRVLKNSQGDGVDLPMIDIQRGRDHGIPSYNSYRKFCELEPAETFEDLDESIPRRVINVLKELYESPDDIDLIVGGLAERQAVDTVFGQTLFCILKNQFVRSACGDRFNYLNKDQRHPFSSEQLTEIKKMTMAALICMNGDDITSMPRNAFLVESITNIGLDCSEIPVMDFTPWKFGREFRFVFG